MLSRPHSPDDKTSSSDIWWSNLITVSTMISEEKGFEKLTLRTNNQTSTLLGTSIDCLNNINQLLFILQHPVQLVVVSCAKITHHVLVAEEEHKRDGIVKFVHLVEVRNLVEIANVDDSEVFHTVGDACDKLVDIINTQGRK
jgi:uncharacterized 2Fe-2S/4Fe-4S cluster protein (DUF4445 family)